MDGSTLKRESLVIIGNFDLLQIFREPIPFNNAMLSAFYFWNPTTNTFHLSYGMVGSTPFDAAAIRGLPPLGETIMSNMSPSHAEYTINLGETSYSAFIEANIGQNFDPVIEYEHVVFLFYWLNGCDFYLRSI